MARRETTTGRAVPSAGPKKLRPSAATPLGPMKKGTPRRLPDDSPFLTTMRERFEWVNESDADQDQREQEDISFEDGNQWPADVLQARRGIAQTNGNSGMPAVPQRPTLVINTIKQPIRVILNQERDADIGAELTPADDFGDLGVVPDDTEVLLREGLIRQRQRASEAHDARRWAYKRAVIAGRGYYMVMTRYLPGKTNDQELYVHRIYNQSGVKLDPTHEQVDGSDASWEFVCTWMPWEKFLREWPKNSLGKTHGLCGTNHADFMGFAEDYPNWYQPAQPATVRADGTSVPGQQQAVRIVDYWYRDSVARELVVYDDDSVAWADELEDPAAVDDALQVDVPDDQAPVAPPTELTRRTVMQSTIKFCKTAGGCVILEETDWAGPDMPIIKVTGDEVLPYDNQRRYEGIVRPARSSCQGLNYVTSKFVETIGLTPIPLLQLDPAAIDGYDDWYKALNTRTLPYAPYRSYDDEGRELRPPTRLPSDPNIQALSAGVQMFGEMIKSTSAVPDPTLGNVDPSVTSGIGIKRLVDNAAKSTNNFLDNLRRAIEYETKVMNNLLYPIYGTRPGRLVRIMTGDGTPGAMAIGALPPSIDPTRAQAMKVAKLTEDASFNILVKISQNSENRRQQFVEMFDTILQADPTQMQVAGDLLYKNMDIPDAKDLAARQKVMLAPAVQQFLAAQAQGGAPPDPHMAALSAQLQAAQTRIQQLEGGLAKTQLETQVEMMIAERKDATDRWKTALTQQTLAEATQAKINQAQAEAVLAAQTKVTAAVLGEKVGVAKQLSGQAHAVASQIVQHAHETGRQTADAVHEVAQTDAQQKNPPPLPPALPGATTPTAAGVPNGPTDQ